MWTMTVSSVELLNFYEMKIPWTGSSSWHLENLIGGYPMRASTAVVCTPCRVYYHMQYLSLDPWLIFLCGVCMHTNSTLSLCVGGFSPGTLVSSHSLKNMLIRGIGLSTSVTTNWWPPGRIQTAQSGLRLNTNISNILQCCWQNMIFISFYLSVQLSILINADP